MSSPPGLIGSSQTTPPRYFLRPGMRAFQAGVKHGLLAENLVDIFYPNKKQKTKHMPPVSQKYVRSTARSKTARKSTTKVRSAVKKAILSMANTKTFQQSDSSLAQNMTMNTIYTANITGKIGFGTADNQRVGDEIHLIGLKIKGNFVTPTASNGYQYRIIVGWSGEEVNPTAWGTGGTGLTAADVFQPSTGGQYQTAAIINPKAFTTLYDQTVDLNSQLTGSADMFGVDFYIPLNKKYPFQAAGTFFGKFKNLYVVVCSTVALAGVPGTTASGGVNLNTMLRFKNM